MQKVKVTYNPFSLGTIERVAPTTLSQREMWTSLMLEKESTKAYNEVVKLTLIPNLGNEINVNYLEFAFLEIISRHDALRSSFSNDGQLIFVKAFDSSIFKRYFEYVDLSFFADPEKELKGYLDKIMTQELSISTDQLFSMKVYKISADKYELVFIAHHIVCDGWSYAIVLSEFTEIFNAKCSGRFFDLETPMQFSEYAFYEKEKGVDLESKKYWQKEFFDFIGKEDLPTIKERSYSRSFKSERIDYTVDPELVSLFKKTCSKNGSSFYSGLISSFAVLMIKIIDLKKLSKGNIGENYDLVIGLSSATQPTQENNKIVGHLVNLLPLRIKKNDDLTLKEFLKSTKSKMLDAFENQFYTYGELIKDLPQYKRTMGEMPLVSVVFNIDQQASDQGVKINNAHAYYHSVPRTHENFEIFINAVSRDNVLTLECQFNSKLYDQLSIKLWLEKFQDVMKLFLSNIDSRVSEINLPGLMIPAEATDNSVKFSTGDFSISHSNKRIQDNKLLSTNEGSELSKLWKEILGLQDTKDIKLESNFFHMGGHSLLAIDLALKLREVFGINIEVKDIFEKPNFGDLLNLLNEKNISVSSNAVTDYLLKHENNELSDLSFSQYQAWYLEQLSEKTTMHYLPSCIVIDSLLDAKVLESSFKVIIEAQLMMQVGFHTKLGKPVQSKEDLKEILSNFRLKVEEYDLNLSDNKLLHEFKEILQSEASKEIQIEKAPLFCLKLYVNLRKKQSVLFFMPHHLIWDGWSFDVFFKQLDKVYTALLNNEKFSSTASMKDFLSIGEITYFDFVRDQLEKVKHGHFDRGIQFNVERFKNGIPTLNLPKKIGASAASEKSSGEVVHFELEKDLIESCISFSKNNEVSLYVLFLSTYKMTLSRYSRASYDSLYGDSFLDEVVIGTPVRNRKHSSLMELFGFFVNTIAVKSQINFEATLISNVENIKREFYEIIEHDEVPFQLVLNELKKHHKDFDGNLFHTFFSFQDVSNREGVLNNCKYKQINIDKAATHTTLDLWIKSSSSKIEGGLEYKTSLVSREFVDKFLNNYLLLLREITSNPTKVLKDVSIAKEEYHQIVDINQSYFNDRINVRVPFIKLIKESLDLYGLQDALQFQDIKISGDILQSESDKVALYLIEKGVQAGDLVGICLERSHELLIYLLGILKSGAGYVPLDPKFPIDRLNYMVVNSDLKYLVTEKSLEHLALPAKNILFKELMFLKEKITSSDKEELSSRLNHISEDNPAYVIYTSGSTGLPKGVSISHKSVTNFLLGMNQLSILGRGDRLLAVTTLSFDIAVLELYLPLLNLATVVVASSYDVMDGKKLLEIINKEKISVMQATATTWRILLSAGFTKNNNLTVLCGGESFPLDLANSLVAKVKRLLNMYGPTETTVWSTVKEINQKELDELSLVTIGKPILNTSVFILDEFLNVLPMGVAGEIYIGGEGLALGYFNRLDLTNERFIFHPKLQVKLYRTGDVGRFLDNGELVCMGRNDGQVKWRGFRIELGEIENQIMKSGFVYECAVVIKEVKLGDQRLLSFISLKDGKNNSNGVEDKLKKFLRENLPHYMIPQSIIILDSLPKTQNGKIDKKSLSFSDNQNINKDVQLENSHIVHQNDLVIREQHAQDDLRNKIDLIWMRLLNLTTIDDSCNFFDAGGNSLLAVELISEISQLLNQDLQLKMLLNYPVLDDFKNAIHKKDFSKSNNHNSLKNINDSYKTLVEIFNFKNEVSSQSPLYVFHGVGGNVLNYISLVPAISNNRSLVAFQSIGLNQDENPHQSIDEMARFYFYELKKYQPMGPYLLSGGSMGGLIALEVARILKSAGDEVYPVIMLDTFGPAFDLEKYTEDNKKGFFQRICDSIKYRYNYGFNTFLYFLFKFLGKKVPLKILVVVMEKINYSTIWKYKSSIFNGDIILIRSKLKEKGWYSDPYLGWRNAINGKIEIYEIDGAHNEFIESPELVIKLRNILKNYK